MTFNKLRGGSAFAGPLAATGAGPARNKNHINWRLVACPLCEAPIQGRCRRRVSERFNPEQPGGHTGEGRWVHLKHPHAERVQAAKKAREDHG